MCFHPKDAESLAALSQKTPPPWDEAEDLNMEHAIKVSEQLSGQQQEQSDQPNTAMGTLLQRLDTPARPDSEHPD